MTSQQSAVSSAAPSAIKSTVKPPCGVLLIDKPKGVTSHDVVASARRILKRRDIGHAGTLDPDASGLLILLLGDATKLSDILLNGNKSYIVDVTFGTKTDSGDLAGNVVASSDVEVTEEAIAKTIPQLVGEFDWEVPVYSAVKVDGKKLYEYARADMPVAVPKKRMEFLSAVLLESVNLSSKMASGGERFTQIARVELTCSKGSYMRKWAEKLGEALGSVAVASGIRRTVSSPYSLELSIPLKDLNVDNAYSGRHWIPIASTLQDWPSIRIEGIEEKLISNGQIPHKMARYLEIEYGGRPGVRAVSRRTGRLVALLAPKSSGFGIQRVFPE